MSNFYIYANSGGCPQNQLDGTRIYNYLSRNGYRWTKDIEEADIIVVNGCGYHQKKEKQYIDVLQRIKASCNPNALVIASGCLPKINPQLFCEIDFHGYIVPVSDLYEIANIIPPVEHQWDDIEPGIHSGRIR